MRCTARRERGKTKREREINRERSKRIKRERGGVNKLIEDIRDGRGQREVRDMDKRTERRGRWQDIERRERTKMQQD